MAEYTRFRFLPEDVQKYRDKYDELFPIYVTGIETLLRLSAFALNIGRKRYARDIKEEVRDYMSDFKSECEERYILGTERTFDYIPPKERAELLYKATIDMQNMIDDIHAMILRIKAKVNLAPTEDNYRKTKKSKPKIKKSIVKKSVTKRRKI